MNRRDSIIALAVLGGAVPVASGAQQTSKIARVGFLTGNLATGQSFKEAFRQGLRDVGYVEGRNVVIEYRDAEGKAERLPALAQELVALKVDIILAPGTQHALAAKQATTSIPIVFADVGDPVAVGLAASLARPGGNVTGLSNLNPSLLGKWLELLKEAVPRLSRIAFIWQPGAVPEGYEKDFLRQVEAAAQALGMRIQFVGVRGPEDFERVFSDMTRARVDAVVVWGGVMLISERKRVVELAATNRLPGTYSMGLFVDAGGLMSYAPNIPDNFRRAAGYVDKILRGAKPADLPIQQPTKFELVINLKTAKALGLTIPPSLVHRADRVIE